MPFYEIPVLVLCQKLTLALMTVAPAAPLLSIQRAFCIAEENFRGSEEPKPTTRESSYDFSLSSVLDNPAETISSGLVYAVQNSEWAVEHRVYLHPLVEACAY